MHDRGDPGQGHPWLRRAPARLWRQEEARVQARGGPLQEGERRPDAGRPRDPAREGREAPGLPGGTGAHGGGVPTGRARGCRRRLEGQGLPGRRQALRLVRRRRDPRLDVPPGARLDRRLVGPVARLARPSPAGTHGGPAPHRAKPQRRACDARAEPRPRPRRDSRGERLRGDDPQEREADPSPAEGRGEEVAMPTVPVLDATGKQAGTMELKGDVFSVEIRAPQWKGGGKPFGPKPRSYEQDLPRAMRREALRAAVAARIADGGLAVIEALDVADGKTKSLVAQLGALGLKGEPTLLVVHELDGHLARASRNVPWLIVETPAHVSVYQLLRARRVVCDRAALQALEQALAG